MNLSPASWIPAVLVAAIVSSSIPASAQVIGQSLRARWDAPSTLTPDQAASVLAREAKGETVSSGTLFEARKYLRTDRSISFAGTVVEKVVEILLDEGLDAEVRLRTLPSVLAWLNVASLRGSAGEDVLRFRGEAVELAVANLDPNFAATTLFHFTFHEDWRFCGTVLCRSPLSAPVREGIAYDLAVPLESTAPAEASSSELVLATGLEGSVHHQFVPTLDPSRFLGAACDPLPSRTRTIDAPGEMSFVHEAARTEHARQNRILCGFFAIADGPDSRFAYSVDGRIASPPAEAGPSAVVNNPLRFSLFE